MLTRLIVVIVSQCTQISTYYVLHLKLIKYYRSIISLFKTLNKLKNELHNSVKFDIRLTLKNKNISKIFETIFL